MGSSLLTNRSAMTALQTLRIVENSLQSTQDRIATGRKLNEAADNTAYWAISNSMKSDSQATSVIKDSLQLGKIPVDQAYTSSQQIKQELQSLKDLVVSAHGMTESDQKKIKTNVEAKINAIKNAIQSGGINGTNYFVQSEDAQAGKPTNTIDIPASYRREGDKVIIDKITINLGEMTLALKASDGSLDFEKGMLGDIFKAGFFQMTTGEVLDSNALGGFATTVQKALDVMGNIDSTLGSAKQQIDSQYEFVNKLIDNLDKSVGTLVDADMNAESARLSALQVQQQLAVQSLSIANQSSQSILSLFR